MIKSEGWLFLRQRRASVSDTVPTAKQRRGRGHVEFYVGSSLHIDATKGYGVTKVSLQDPCSLKLRSDDEYHSVRENENKHHPPSYPYAQRSPKLLQSPRNITLPGLLVHRRLPHRSLLSSFPSSPLSQAPARFPCLLHRSHLPADERWRNRLQRDQKTSQYFDRRAKCRTQRGCHRNEQRRLRVSHRTGAGERFQERLTRRLYIPVIPGHIGKFHTYQHRLTQLPAYAYT